MNDRFHEIPARIDQTIAVVEELVDRIDHFETETLPILGRTADAVLIPVQLIENGYIAVETLFLRISQAFENDLDQRRWHSHLLEKMALEILDVRPRVISDQLYRNLAELMRFRHFKRYYFALDYDWRKVDLLLQIFRESLPLLKEELHAFSELVRASLTTDDDKE